MLRSLKVGGRCAVIVPDGVLFRTSNDYITIRKEIIENNQLEGVISMPAGIFRPYAAVSTAILLFTKTGKGGTSNVWFYDMIADGYSLDDKRQKIENDDIPDIVAEWNKRTDYSERKRTEKFFLVPIKEIRDNGFDLSINKYKETVFEEIEYDSPETIISQIIEVENEKHEELEKLEKLIV